MCIPGDDPQNCGIDVKLIFEWGNQHLDHAIVILGIILLVLLLYISIAIYLERRK